MGQEEGSDSSSSSRPTHRDRIGIGVTGMAPLQLQETPTLSYIHDFDVIRLRAGFAAFYGRIGIPHRRAGYRNVWHHKGSLAWISNFGVETPIWRVGERFTLYLGTDLGYTQYRETGYLFQTLLLNPELRISERLSLAFEMSFGVGKRFENGEEGRNRGISHRPLSLFLHYRF